MKLDEFRIPSSSIQQIRNLHAYNTNKFTSNINKNSDQLHFKNIIHYYCY